MKKLLMSVIAAVCMGQAFSQSVSSATIDDSLRVWGHTYLNSLKVSNGTTLDRLRTADDAQFDQNIFVDSSAGIAGNLGVGGYATIEGAFKVGGTTLLVGATTFRDDVILDSVADVTDALNSSVLMRGDDGAIQKVNTWDFVEGFGTLLYTLNCLEDGSGNVASPKWSNGTNKLFTACNATKVGIGTNDPQHKFHVNGGGFFQNYLYVNGNTGIGAAPNSFSKFKVGNPSVAAGIEVDQSGNTTEYAKLLVMRYDEPTTEIIKVENTAEDYIPFLLESNGKMTIHNGTREIFQLHSNGQLKVRRVTIDQQEWADYVFEPSYKLMPLTELERYVQTHRHLPNVPSETEVMERGVDIAAMNKALLEKVEQLTLYLIEQEKKNNAQDQLINELQQQLNQAQGK